MAGRERKHWFSGDICTYIYISVLYSEKVIIKQLFQRPHIYMEKKENIWVWFMDSLQILYIWLSNNSHHDDLLSTGFYLLNLDSCWWTNAHFKLLNSGTTSQLTVQFQWCQYLYLHSSVCLCNYFTILLHFTLIL